MTADHYLELFKKKEASAHQELMSYLLFADEFEHFYANYEEKVLRPDLYGKTVRCSSKQFPHIYEIAQRVSGELKMELPELFVYEDFYYGTDCKGIEKSWIEISAKTVTDFSEQELNYLLTRELLKIQKKWVKTHLVCTQAIAVLPELSMIGIGHDVVQKNLKVAFAKWSRIANYIVDAESYLIVKEIKPCTQAILKCILNSCRLAQAINLTEYLTQGTEISATDDIVSNYSKYDELVPYAPLRIKNLIAFASYSAVDPAKEGA